LEQNIAAIQVLAKTLLSLMYRQEQIDSFIKEKTGIDKLKPSDDLLNDQGVCGDDFHELIDEYAKVFNVDMAGYLWYFHADEEGGWNSIGGSFFKPPYQRVTHISVTPALLLEIANKGRWDIKYSPHKLPKRRWDIIINRVVFVVVVSWALYSCLR
jgi:hypothetical protein